VAIKILTPESAGFRARLLHRVQAAADLDHPHILPVYEAGEANGTVFIAMRYAPGGDARSLLGPPLALARAWKVIAQVASALDAAHARGVIHRDVKPANMLLEASEVYLADFGMGREWPPDEITAAARFAGTVDYAAPEQIQGRALDEHADLYSLACAGYELLCGTPPFGPDGGLTALYAQLYAPPPAASTRRPDLPVAADAVLATALAKNPADRYESCGQFAEELRKALGLVSGGPFRSRSLSNAVLAPGGDPRAPVGPRSLSWPYEAAVASSPDLTGAPDLPGAPDGPEPRPRWRRPRVIRLALAGVAVAVAAGVAIGVALTGGSAPVSSPPVSAPLVSAPVVSSPPVSSPPVSSPPVSSSPSAFTLASRQAAAVNDVLSSSTVTLKALQGAVSEVFDCTNLSGAVRQIQNVVNQRGTEYNQASALSTSALASGAIVKSDLIAALRSSLEADKDFLTWARQQLNPGCTPAAQSSAYSAAENASQQAGVSKQAFVQVWNPVAARYGIQQKPPGSF
jgi:serine/threonine protein kinase